jgi:hypothetical protein
MSLSALLAAQPKLEIAEQKQSFGNVKQGEPVILNYAIANKGNAPLVFERYEVSCHCTSADLPQEPVPPGGTATITVTFKTSSAYGLQDRIVKVYSNAAKSPAKLRFKGIVEGGKKD